MNPTWQSLFLDLIIHLSVQIIQIKLKFEPVHTKDKSVKYKASMVTARNDPRINSHQKIQLVGWRANCDMQVILDYHACVEYLCKYAVKGEPRSNTLKNAFRTVVGNLKTNTDPIKVMKKIMIKALGERDFSARETMHLLLSLKLHSSSFQVLSVNLDGTRSLKKNVKDPNSSCTNDSILDKYSKRETFKNDLPLVMKLNLAHFVTNYKIVNSKLVKQSSKIIPRFFPTYSANPKGANYPLYCKYQLLKYKPWRNSPNDAWNYETVLDSTYINCWLEFLNSSVVNDYVPNWETHLQNVLDNVVQDDNDSNFINRCEHENPPQEEWMILSNYHKLQGTHQHPEKSYNWQFDSAKYTVAQIVSMTKWITNKKADYTVAAKDNQVNTATFSRKQKLAYDIIVKHSSKTMPKEQLLLIIIGEGGTGKSYLINAIRNYLKDSCTITATTGKAAFNINGITIHSFLKLPVGRMAKKDLSGQSLHTLQDNLLSVEYIIIDEYSMLGQKTIGWIDRRCRQATGFKDSLFGGKSIILIGDPGQLPPVGDKPLYHDKPSNPIAEQGYLAYRMFDNVVELDVNQRVRGNEKDQVIFKGILSRLRTAEITLSDWKLLLTRQPNVVLNINDFAGATRLYYSNEEVAKYNYDHSVKLNTPVAEIHARHSSNDAKCVSSQDMFGLHPHILISKGAKVILTMNLWPSVGLCNGSTGTIIDIIYAENHAPPDLPIAVLVKFDDYSVPSFANMPSCVPVRPVTATVNIENSLLERQQLPLTLAWALTIHKSQGMTLEKAWIDIGKKETTLGMTYVAISRVRNLLSLIIEPMTFDRLTSLKKNGTLQYRLTEEKRLKAIASLITL